MYPAQLVMPMKEELTEYGFSELLTPADVDKVMKQSGTTFIVINSVCGCSAGAARPGAVMAIQKATKKPANIFTTFAGFDIDAVKRLREYLLPYPPSSPSMALFKDGKLVHFVERHLIEGSNATMIANHLMEVFNTHC